MVQIRAEEKTSSSWISGNKSKFYLFVITIKMILYLLFNIELYIFRRYPFLNDSRFIHVTDVSRIVYIKENSYSLLT